MVKNFLVKFNQLLFVRADTRKVEKVEEFHFNCALLLTEPSAETFRDGFETGKVLIDIRMHLKPGGACETMELALECTSKTCQVCLAKFKTCFNRFGYQNAFLQRFMQLIGKYPQPILSSTIQRLDGHVCYHLVGHINLGKMVISKVQDFVGVRQESTFPKISKHIIANFPINLFVISAKMLATLMRYTTRDNQ